MTIDVKYMSEQQIEHDALGLLKAYFHERGQPIQIPIPVDEILETYLGFSLGFDDLNSRLGGPSADILGAMWVDQREVLIDQSLDPDEHPEMEGRFHFTCGHEAGHWWEHEPYIISPDSQATLFDDNQQKPRVICRSSQAKERIEWQADYFSSCLLMPRQHVLDAWSARFGSLKPFVFADVADRADRNWTRRNKYRASWPRDLHADAFETVSKEFNPTFRVSMQAMQIRLENLGLLRIGHPVERDLFGGV